ncbi:MAG: metalloregulator ArsR/SmtB family transcription factor [Flavobacteriaceae bacterium]|nr:metalloregulator ArsR/SmtB family transcription factor [Flavobacteriaceae bacterium]
MHHVDFKENSYRLIANIAKALGNAHRLELLELVSNGPKNVEELAKEARLSFANTSQHLQILKQLNLVKTKRVFTSIIYSVADTSIPLLLKYLHKTAYNQSLELKHTILDFRKQTGITSVEINDISDTNYILLDVRSESEFNFGHKKGAINIPYAIIDKSMNTLDKDKLIVAYCRGELCTFADKVVKHLQEAGFNAVRLKEIIMTKTG